MTSEDEHASQVRFNRLWGSINLAALIAAIILIILSFATGWPGD